MSFPFGCLLISASWKRVFHPRAIGHRIISSMILHAMAVERGKVLGLEVPNFEIRNAESRVKLEL